LAPRTKDTFKNEKKILELLKKIEEVADRDHDGHFTIMKFTTNWRACFGTPYNDPITDLSMTKDDPCYEATVPAMPKGKTLEAALKNLIKKETLKRLGA
jgi:hypothetical protein